MALTWSCYWMAPPLRRMRGMSASEVRLSGGGRP
jgi:hypothetical protein